ncbi:beta-1,6-N-acetylglucosaminyltransferase [Arundinibacter roseus]|uniref:Peptide O-xylosyltransferase n=1 Tax=Arundinibacter roseus TaxID=2070510 RepID=A0A4R4KBN4_9BACT|nr:beta-1,6-N-acetylglucosaminyltransferase [Arundinibacter roseus]TDB65304.1 hypothetical protein EZE20_11435 [Arundinibacter roseus]
MEFKFAIIILTHKNLNQVVDLVKTLTHPNVNIYIHVDKKAKSEMKCLDYLANYKNITIISEIYCKWSHFSVVEATMLCLSKAITDKNNYISLISGQDLPLININKIYDFFKRNYTKNFFDYYEYTNYFFEDYLIADSYFFHIKNKIIAYPSYELPKSIHQYIIHHIIGLYVNPKKRDFSLYYGQQWFNISSESAKKIINVWNSNNKFQIFFRHSFTPENFFVPTIINYIEGLENVENTCLRLVDWDRLTQSNIPIIKDDWNKPRMSNHPHIFTKNDWDLLTESSKKGILFARKFDLSVDEDIFNLVRNKLCCE